MSRRGAIVALGTIVAVVLAAQPAGAWRPKKERAIEYASTRSGSVSFAVIGPHAGVFRHRARTKVPAASVIKVMFLVAYLRSSDVKDRKLNESDRDLLAPMIKVSDNDSATRIADMLGPDDMNRLARRAGMQNFTYTRPWGASRVTAVDQSRFMYTIENYIPKRHEGYARYLLSHVDPSQRWGIGEIRRPEWKFFFKGGWGSGTGAVCHQVAFIQRDGERIAVSVMITNSPSHEYATATLKGVFDRLLKDLPR
jgi:Beta-lactamase enzyme family